MFSFNRSILKRLALGSKKFLSTTPVYAKTHCCKLLVVGGGCGGCNVAARFAKILCQNEIIVVEPEDVHYYQPYFTLIGGGVKRLKDCVRTTIEVLPQGVTWLQDAVQHFCPQTNAVVTKSGDIIEYDFMVVAVGVNLDFAEVSGLSEALDNYRNVCTIFSPKYAEKTFKCLREFVHGSAVFTAPQTPSKCLAAAFKICFIAHDYFKREDKLGDVDFIFASGQKSLFVVEKYEKTLVEIAKRKRVDLHFNTNLVEVVPDRKKAVFECLNKPGSKISMEYDMLHVTPPMSPPKALKDCKELVNKFKYIDVDKNTLQHKKYPNVFALGDCSPGTTNKTASGASNQAIVVFRNLSDALQGRKPQAHYDGYTACPIVTGYGKCLLAEFNYDLKLCESFPFDQNTESKLMYYLKRDVMPQVYWHLILKGKYSSTESIRKIMRMLRIK